MLQQKTVSRFIKKCGELAEKLHKAIMIPESNFRGEEGSSISNGGPPSLGLAPKVKTPRQSLVRKTDLCVDCVSEHG